MMDDLLLAPTAADVEGVLARRVRAARKARGWTQGELATRSGLSIATITRLERSGQGQISTLLAVCAALDRLDDFDALLRPSQPTTLAELRRRRT